MKSYQWFWDHCLYMQTCKRVLNFFKPQHCYTDSQTTSKSEYPESHLLPVLKANPTVLRTFCWARHWGRLHSGIAWDRWCGVFWFDFSLDRNYSVGGSLVSVRLQFEISDKGRYRHPADYNCNALGWMWSASITQCTTWGPSEHLLVDSCCQNLLAALCFALTLFKEGAAV